MDSSNPSVDDADASLLIPLSNEEITELDAGALAELGILAHDVIVRRIRLRNHNDIIPGSIVTERKAIVEDLKMRHLKTKTPIYRIDFWKFAFTKTFVMFAYDMDDLNDHIISQFTMEMAWYGVLNSLYKKWVGSSKLPLEMKQKKLAFARLQANPMYSERTRQYWDKKAKKVMQNHGLSLPIEKNGYNFEGLFRDGKVSRPKKSRGAMNDDMLLQKIVPLDKKRTVEDMLREQRELLGNPEVDMEQIARTAEQEVASARMKLDSLHVSEYNDHGHNTSDDDGSIAEEIIKPTDVDGEEDVEMASNGNEEVESLYEDDEEFNGFSDDDSDEDRIDTTINRLQVVERKNGTWRRLGEVEEDTNGDSSKGKSSDKDGDDEMSSSPDEQDVQTTQTLTSLTTRLTLDEILHRTIQTTRLNQTDPVSQTTTPSDSTTRPMAIPRTSTPRQCKSGHQTQVPAAAKRIPIHYSFESIQLTKNSSKKKREREIDSEVEDGLERKKKR